VVESKTTKYLCEPKKASEMEAKDVLAKAKAAVAWCQHATEHEKKHGGKPWSYLLIPHDQVSENKTLKGLAATFCRA
jgi:type III restriction enzyme